MLVLLPHKVEETRTGLRSRLLKVFLRRGGGVGLTDHGRPHPWHGRTRDPGLPTDYERRTVRGSFPTRNSSRYTAHPVLSVKLGVCVESMGPTSFHFGLFDGRRGLEGGIEGKGDGARPKFGSKEEKC